MLERDGIANVLSTPQIATLNGNTASISVGTTQYFRMKSSTVQGSTTPIQTESERFETIEATVSLSITPWVTSSREVTVEVNPVFQIPGNSPDPTQIPPTINKRELKSTIRLKDGETYILGGLVENTKQETVKKVPVLGSIPFLGVLFRNKSTTETKNRLMIFLTPHIYYGSEGAVNSDDVMKKLME
jgi:type IV pilus assembly protein PilQ